MESTEIHYDREGRSVGTAVVTFKKSADALKAVDEYDSAQVDGRAMYVKVIANKSPTVMVPQRQMVQPVPVRQSATVKMAARGKGGRLNQAKGQQKQNNGKGRGAEGRGAGKGGRAVQKRSGGKGKGGKGKEKPVSASDLDADMDSYHAQNDSATILSSGGQPLPVK